MIKLSEISVEVGDDPMEYRGGPPTCEVRASHKWTARLFCEPRAEKETIQHARLELWRAIYGEILSDLNDYAHFVLSRATWTQTQFDELKEKTQILLDKYTPE